MKEAFESQAKWTKSDSDFTAQIPLSQLEPVTRYYLNVLVNGTPQLSRVTEFRSFPPAGADTKLKLV